MDPFEAFAKQVIAMAEAIERGQTDALDYRLTDSYRQLQQLAASLDRQLNIDEILNRVLLFKVTRVQELLRILNGPEIQLSCLREANTQTLASMLVYRHPITISRIDPAQLENAFDRLLQLAASHSRSRTDYSITTIPSVHPGKFVFHSEETLSLAEVERFSNSLPRQRPIPIHEIVAAQDIDTFFRRFLMLLIMISRGIVVYDPLTRTISCP